MNKDSTPVKITEMKIAESMEPLCRDKMLKEMRKEKEFEEDKLTAVRLSKEKDYNEKISNTIFGTGLKPSIVGTMKTENKMMDYDFVSFDKVVKKDPLEYIDGSKCDYDVGFDKNKIPTSFLQIKEGEIQKGKEWYLNNDPKLPEEIAEMMARYNWGDLKYMTKKSLKNQKKKLGKKNKDIGEEYGLTRKVATKNNPIIVTFD
tara:strand:- start:708 stop:1316 length:609 start_codon:yes stop_codon:yes gene_type:complete